MVRHDKEKLEKKIKEYPTPEGLEFVEVFDCNYKPHPFTIGPKHVAYAADNHNGMLGDETIEAVPCAAPGCHRPYDEHTWNSILLYKFTGKVKSEDFKTYAQALFDTEQLEAKGIEGFNFLEPEAGKGWA